jgi:hypothetical protein
VHLERPAELLLDSADLALVRRHHAHPDAAPRVHRLLEQTLHDSDHGGGLDVVGQAPVALSGALVPVVDIDERVGAEHGARQVPPLIAAEQDVGAVSDPAAVESRHRELAYHRVHPVLHVEEVFGLTQGAQPMQQASPKASIITDLNKVVQQKEERLNSALTLFSAVKNLFTVQTKRVKEKFTWLLTRAGSWCSSPMRTA